jgi:3-oxoacyl-[acyl-carrier protein] reductase
MGISTELSKAFSLEGRVAVITGAASGLGREIARVFSQAGAKIVLADINLDGLEGTAAIVREAGGTAIVCRVDAAVPADVDELADAAVKAFGRIDSWVNAAGIAFLAPVDGTDPAAAARLLSINALGVQWGITAASRAMKQSHGGTIVNISSAGGIQPVPQMSVYCMSKAAVNQLTKISALELGSSGIRVNAVAPGWIDTPMGSQIYRDDQGEIIPEMREKVLKEQAAQSLIGILGTPNDIALAALYLASDASRFVTGQVLTVNGGVSM